MKQKKLLENLEKHIFSRIFKQIRKLKNKGHEFVTVAVYDSL